MNELEEIDWKELVRRNIRGFAVWTTPCRLASYCGMLESIRFGNPKVNPEEEDSLLYVSFAWIASISTSEYRAGSAAWTKVPEECGWHQTLNPESETCHTGRDELRGIFYRIAVMTVYPEWEGDMKTEDVAGL